jgi:hypothetical protein
MDRLEANLAILAVLERYLHAHPDVRFGQALRNLRIVEQAQLDDDTVIWKDAFNEEPRDTLARMNTVDVTGR